MSNSNQDEESIFQAARQVADPAARRDYLSHACGKNDSFRARVEALLASHEQDDQFLKSVATPAAVLPSPSGRGAGGEGAVTTGSFSETPGCQIGRYKLLQKLGEGGFGVVYMAEQREPVERRVALKIIKPGMDTKQVIARFEAERQALALMDHPNVARVLDAGTTDTGRPYFVMDLVKGVPITQYCEEHQLTPRERLQLLLPVCQAVQHAHQKGIIHRDLKPTNILVAEYDHQAVPKVIDFGIAKAMGQRLTEKTMFTEFGQVVGTIEYMSPEQAKLNQLDIDTRSDIYSLGVLLYELLTGQTPFDKKRLHSAAFDEMLRIIREEEPPKPSTKISQLQKSRVGSAHLRLGVPVGREANHSQSPSGLLRRLFNPKSKIQNLKSPAELDCIVMKCLEKDRSRRYETASGLSRDLERYLANEPIHARAPTTAYRLRKFAQRHKAAALATLLIAASLLLGTIISTWQAIRATAAEKDTARELARAVNAEAESATNLHKLQQVAREWATSETFTGDAQRAEAAIRLAEAASVSKTWTEILRAQAEIDQGLHSAAVARLTPITDDRGSTVDNDSRLAALHAMAYAHILKGGVDRGYIDCMRRASALNVQPGPEAGMFKALTEIWFDPESSLATLHAAVKKRAYPASFLIRANALSVRGRTLKGIDEALRNLDHFEEFAGNSSSLFAARMNAHLSGYDIAKSVGDADAMKLHLQKLAMFTDRLEKQPPTLLGATYLGAIYYRLDELEELVAVAKSVDWDDSPLIEYGLANIFELCDDVTKTLDVVRQLRADDRNATLLYARALLLAESSEHRHQAGEIAHRLVSEYPDSPNAQFGGLRILAILGLRDQLKEQAQRALEQTGSSAMFGWHVDRSMRYLSGEWDEARLLTEASNSVVMESQAYYTIGVGQLARGNRDAARSAFEKGVRTASFDAYTCYWAAAHLARMNRDPTWPSWVEKRP